MLCIRARLKGGTHKGQINEQLPKTHLGFCANSALTTITIFVRHTPGCKYAGDEFAKRCSCRKHLRWTFNGKQFRKQAGTRSWAEAETAKRSLEDQLTGKPAVEPVEQPTGRLIGDCASLFTKEKSLENISKFGVGDHKREMARLERYCNGRGIFTVDRITREVVLEYMAGWPALYPSSWTRWRNRSRLNSFLFYCERNGWITKAPKLPRVVPDEQPTTPLAPEEFKKLLDTVPTAIKDEREAVRLRSLFLLMRWSGLAIRDALTLSKEEIQDTGKGFYRVVTSRQKTGTHVSVPVQAAVMDEILGTPNDNPEYLFWDGKRDAYLFSVCMGRRVRRAFEAAGLDDGQHMKSHRLRDTFAVELLSRGVPMEEVSKLLGHTSIKTTEKHYAKWVKGRQDRLDALVTATWAAV